MPRERDAYHRKRLYTRLELNAKGWLSSGLG